MVYRSKELRVDEIVWGAKGLERDLEGEQMV